MTSDAAARIQADAVRDYISKYLQQNGYLPGEQDKNSHNEDFKANAMAATAKNDNAQKSSGGQAKK